MLKSIQNLTFKSKFNQKTFLTKIFPNSLISNSFLLVNTPKKLFSYDNDGDSNSNFSKLEYNNSRRSQGDHRVYYINN